MVVCQTVYGSGVLCYHLMFNCWHLIIMPILALPLFFGTLPRLLLGTHFLTIAYVMKGMSPPGCAIFTPGTWTAGSISPHQNTSSGKLNGYSALVLFAFRKQNGTGRNKKLFIKTFLVYGSIARRQQLTRMESSLEVLLYSFQLAG